MVESSSRDQVRAGYCCGFSAHPQLIQAGSSKQELPQTTSCSPERRPGPSEHPVFRTRHLRQTPQSPIAGANISSTAYMPCDMDNVTCRGAHAGVYRGEQNCCVLQRTVLCACLQTAEINGRTMFLSPDGTLSIDDIRLLLFTSDN
ncbi:hypothetical protein STEG23_008090 [Scotinomys teguina]